MNLFSLYKDNQHHFYNDDFFLEWAEVKLHEIKGKIGAQYDSKPIIQPILTNSLLEVFRLVEVTNCTTRTRIKKKSSTISLD